MASGAETSSVAESSRFAVYALAGQGRALGMQHGAAVCDRAKAFLSDRLVRLNALLPKPTSLEQLRPELRAYYDVIAECLPQMAEEIDGFAEGAGITRDEATLLQVRREILGYSTVPTRGDCTTFVRLDGGDSVVGQTVDLNGGLEQEGYVLQVSDAGSDSRQLVMLNFTGLSGYLGMNSHGLAIGINLVLAGRWKPGIPAYMALRHLLERAECVEDCIELLERLPLASSRSFTVCDGRSAAYVEMADGKRCWHRGSCLVHTNHFRDPTLAKLDQLNIFARNGSKRRLQTCEQHLSRLERAWSPDAYWTILEDDHICVEGGGAIGREVTVARVLMMPQKRRFLVKRGARREVMAQALDCRGGDRDL